MFLFITNGPGTVRTVFLFLGLVVIQIRWKEAISNPRCHHTARYWWSPERGGNLIEASGDAICD